MSDLKDAAGRLGLRRVGVRFDRSKVPLNRPAIAFLSTPGEGHFIILRPIGVTGKVVQVIDPPSGPVVMDDDRLLASPAWTGRLLVPETRAEWIGTRGWVVAPVALLVLLGGFLTRRRARSHHRTVASPRV